MLAGIDNLGMANTIPNISLFKCRQKFWIIFQQFLVNITCPSWSVSSNNSQTAVGPITDPHPHYHGCFLLLIYFQHHCQPSFCKLIRFSLYIFLSRETAFRVSSLNWFRHIKQWFFQFVSFITFVIASESFWKLRIFMISLKINLISIRSRQFSPSVLILWQPGDTGGPNGSCRERSPLPLCLVTLAC